MIAMEVFGVTATATYFRDGVRLFQLEQRKKMREAANVVKRDVVAKVISLFGARRKPHKSKAGKPLGPLYRQIGVRVFATRSDVVALIRPNAKAFYGRFQETGLDVQAQGRSTGRKIGAGFMRRKINERGKPYHFRLPRKPFLEPVAQADETKVAQIIGSSYGVFYRGGA
jgi:hypothetical protein